MSAPAKREKAPKLPPSESSDPTPGQRRRAAPRPTASLLKPYEPKLKQMVATLAAIEQTLQAVDLKATHIADQILQALQVPDTWDRTLRRLHQETDTLQEKLRSIQRTAAATHHKEVCYTEIFAYARLALATQQLEAPAFIVLVGRLCRLVEALPDAWWMARKDWPLGAWMALLHDAEAVEAALNEAVRSVPEDVLEAPVGEVDDVP